MYHPTRPRAQPPAQPQDWCRRVSWPDDNVMIDRNVDRLCASASGPDHLYGRGFRIPAQPKVKTCGTLPSSRSGSHLLLP